jgi:hypothetical protein
MAPAFAAGGGPNYEDDALAAEVKHGDSRVQSTQSVQCEVYYKAGSVPVTLCLSIIRPEKVIVLPTVKEDVRIHLMLEYVYDMLTGKNKRLLASLTEVFTEEQCVICLDAEPQCIFVKCGHAAICNTCKPLLKEQKCPLCRGFILAAIQK